LRYVEQFKDGLNNFELLLKLQFKILACVMRCERLFKSFFIMMQILLLLTGCKNTYGKKCW
ncbi:hypothetical protein CKQ90_29470, partial [Klebsiella pneumoniae]